MNIFYELATHNRIQKAYAEEKKLLRTLPRIYKTIDRKIAKLKKATHMRCLHDCGYCCEQSLLDIHPIEIFPLVFALYLKKQLPFYLDHFNNDPANHQCLFYRVEKPGHGYCTQYQWRPLTCRVFGFATRRDKYGQDELVCCKLIKETTPNDFAAAAKLVAAGNHIVRMSDYSYQISLLATHLVTKRMPINQAFAFAAHRILHITKTGRMT
jgi:Fe-S-cluster containining protein